MSTETLDAAIARIMEHLNPPEHLAWEVEKILRWGACEGGVNAYEVGERLNVHRRTLSKWLARSGLPPISTLSAWGRLIPSLVRYREVGSQAVVALDMGWGDQSTLSRSLCRYLGERPSEWLGRGGDLSEAVDEMVGTWRAAA